MNLPLDQSPVYLPTSSPAMGLGTFHCLPAEVHSLILSYIPDISTLHALVQASRQSHQVYRTLQRAILESVVKRQIPDPLLSALLRIRAFDLARAECFDFKVLSDEVDKFEDTIEVQSRYKLSTEESKWLVSRNRLVEDFISEFASSKILRLENLCGKKDSKSLGESSRVGVDQSIYQLSAVEHHRLRRAFISLDFIGCLSGACTLAGATDHAEDTEDVDDMMYYLASTTLLQFWASIRDRKNQAEELNCVIQHVWQIADMYRPESPDYSTQSQPMDYGSPYGNRTILGVSNALGPCLSKGLPGFKSGLTSLLEGSSVRHNRISRQELIRIRAVLEGRTSAILVRVMKPLTSRLAYPAANRYEVQTLGTKLDDESILAIEQVYTQNDIDCSNAASLWARNLPPLVNGPSISDDMRSYGYAIWSDERFHRLVTKKR